MELSTMPRRHCCDVVSGHDRERPAWPVTAGRIGPALPDNRRGAMRSRAVWFRSSLFWPLHAPLLLLAVLTVMFRVSDADIEICRWLYEHGHHPGWRTPSALLHCLYEYGPLPALALGIGGMAIGILGTFWQRLRPYREAGFFLAAMLALGPGLIVNGVFKPYWQRPRPLQTLAFGGSEPFVPVWELGASPHCKSFPSGHASMGFYLLAPAFLCHRRRRLALTFVAVGLAGGLLVGAGRVMQGAHYPSDVVWSAGMVYLSGLVLFGMFQLAKSAGQRAADSARASPEPALVLLRFPGSDRNRVTKPAAAEPPRRAA
jgi:membrane-associated PAP2 superfamily phosphatase